jgi:Sugar kinases, ribokinase family
MKPRILVVGSAYTDFFIKADRIPTAGQSALGDRYEYLPGGRGIYSALTFTGLGAECIICAKIGADSHGSRLKAFAESRGMDTRFMTIERQVQTGLVAVITESGSPGRNIIYPGANKRLRSSDVEEAFTTYPDAIFTQLDLPFSTVASAVSFAHTQDVPCFLDASFIGGSDRELQLEQLDPMEIFITDETAVFTYTAITPTDQDKCIRACLALSHRVTAKYIIIKLSSRGLFLYDGTYFKIIAPYDVTAVDPSAAGDAFSAALTLEYLRSHDAKRACEFANIVSSIVLSRPGASASIPNIEEVAEFIANNTIAFKL